MFPVHALLFNLRVTVPAEWVVVREVVYFRKCCLSPIRMNSVLEELRVRRFAVIQEEICNVVEQFPVE